MIRCKVAVDQADGPGASTRGDWKRKSSAWPLAAHGTLL